MYFEYRNVKVFRNFLHSDTVCQIQCNKFNVKQLKTHLNIAPSVV